MSSTTKCETDSEQSEKNSSGSDDLQCVDFIEKSRWTDFQLTVEGKNLYVPKSFLALVSPVFRLMFESEFKEKGLDVLPLPGKKYEDVLTFLKCTHPGTRLKVTYHIVPNVLPLAHEYQVKWLLDECTNVMIMKMNASKFVDTFKAQWRTQNIIDLVMEYCTICILAEKYGLLSVIERFLVRFSSINYKFYKDQTEFKEISREVQFRLLQRRLASLEKDV